MGNNVSYDFEKGLIITILLQYNQLTHSLIYFSLY